MPQGSTPPQEIMRLTSRLEEVRGHAPKTWSGKLIKSIHAGWLRYRIACEEDIIQFYGHPE